MIQLVRFNRLPAVAVLIAIGHMALVARAEETAQPGGEGQLEFFEKTIRPLLVERCQKCHGPEKQEAGLRLDRREPALKGGDSGPVIVPGEPEKSRLIEVVRYDGDTQMPPSGKLPEDELAALVAWVKQGAAWPAEQGDVAGAVGSAANAAQAATDHWAFQPLTRPAPPAVKQQDGCATPIDAFILHELEKQNLTPATRADRRTLLRRATYDLIGLPPTIAEVEAFERDESPDAWSRVIDRLLDSPHYGERWARHWLDVARYADTKGYVFTQERRYPFSYTYRDYVIRAFNEDLPYDRFVVEQLAADRLPLGDDKHALAALGFLTLGRRFMLNTHDIIDDRIDVVSRGLLGLTVTCARCHDHKFDPIPTADYYSLYGVFASSVEPDEEPLLGMPEESAAYEQFKTELAARQKAFDDYRAQKLNELAASLRAQAGDYLVGLVRQRSGESASDEAMLSLGKGELRPRLLQRWRDYLTRTASAHHPVFAPWHELAAIAPADFSTRSGEIYSRLAGAPDAAKPVNAAVAAALAQRRPATMMDLAAVYSELLAGADKQWTEARAANASLEKLPDAAAEELRQVLYGGDSPTVISDEQGPRLFDRDVKAHLTELKKKIEELEVNSPAAPPRAMALVDAPQPTEPHIFIRGNPARSGEAVPRRFLEVLSRGERKPFQQGSGRLELAQAIANPENPLTARVLVNRVWLHHFGQALVRTPSDFGTRSEPPSHPALLDWLAGSFIDQGWSIKKLHRLIMLSSAYQQASDERPECAVVDPENRLMWRMNRRRLEFEALRDSYLAAAGRLDRKLGGRPIDLWAQPFTARRSVYAYLDRQDLPGVFRIFDMANPDVSNDQRPRTTVPQQALFAMNSPFVLEQARHVVARPEIAAEVDPTRRLQALYRTVLARSPRPEEIELGLRFVNSPPAAADTKLNAWELYAQALLSANEFVFVD
ncbi:MAG TPA: PSD1 and planctomycete cytochrome C domain-containing protein [Pirellulales bacterium]